MKTKVLGYGSTDPNKIVSHYRELERINDDTYTYLYDKCEQDESQDTLVVVLKIENVYFESDTVSRGFLQGRDVGRMGSEYIANFKQNIDEAMQTGRHVNLLNVRIFEELGWDSKPLSEYREKRMERLETERKQERERQAQAEEQAARETAERERLRLEKVRAEFIAGSNIEACDFIRLCQMAGVPIPLRTHGTLNARILRVNIDETLYYLPIRGKRKPDTTGCFKLIRAYAETITEAHKS